jgi:hypothetical protein
MEYKFYFSFKSFEWQNKIQEKKVIRNTTSIFLVKLLLKYIGWKDIYNRTLKAPIHLYNTRF